MRGMAALLAEEASVADIRVDELLRRPLELSCLVVGVNDTAIDVATDGFRNCTQRKALLSPAALYHYNTENSYSVFNNRKLITATEVTTTTVNVRSRYTRIPESILLFDILKSLNATIIPYHFKGTGRGQDRLIYKVHRKEIDLSLLPAGLSEEEDALIDARAINAFRSIVFHSRKAGLSEEEDALIDARAINAFRSIVFHSRKDCLFGSCTNLTKFLLFLFATLVGRGYPEPPPRRSNGTRIICLFWTIGMLSICAHLQSAITSEMNAPVVERKIKDSDDLLKLAKAKRVLPCLEQSSFSERFIMTSTTEVGIVLRELLKSCPDCINTKSGRDGKCLDLAKRGTHVYIRVYDVITKMFCDRLGVAASEDSFRFLPNAPMMAKGFPCGPAFKRLVVELREHGHEQKTARIDIWNIMRTFRGASSDTADVAPISFWDHYLIIAGGTLIDHHVPRLLRETVVSARHPLNVVLLTLKGTPPKDWNSVLKSVQLPIIQWNRLGAEQLNELKVHVNHNRKVWVVVPWSDMKQRSHLFSKLNEAVFELSLVRFVIALQPGEILPHGQFTELACIVVGVNDTAIDVATDGYRSCTQRKALLSPAALFDYNTDTSYSVFKNRKLITATEITMTSVNVYRRYTRIPESVLLFNILKSLNATILPYHFKGTGRGQERLIYKVHRKEIDLSLFPAGLSEEEDALIDARAINAFRSIVFHSRKGMRVAPRLSHMLLYSGHLLTAIEISAVLIVLVYLFQDHLLDSRTSLTKLLLFLFATLVGQGYPEPPPRRTNVTRIICLFWTIGMLSICAHLQSAITSEVNVPVVERKIKNSDDLLKLAKAKRVLPCLEQSSYSERFIMTSTTEVGTVLRELLKNCRDCVNTKSGRDGKCFDLAKRGTHVYIRVYDVLTNLFWDRYGIAASEDSFRFMPSAPMMAKGFPCGPALKCLVMELREHGHEQKTVGMKIWNITHNFRGASSDTANVAPISFWEHYLIYAGGTLLACVSFILELCWAHAGQRKREHDF
ncbi:hypothetical protein HPB52_002994 [Rhipicephalus sanguineus]|uniref:Ionotropic glutamate receptor C-terminal domain-containing protein n=1 Tax=Rhipicephalus sanguineus TaxID=34632 RepID=A0A9D4SZG3_RHISA|nr:hypothetical protein HPB52_002994 [Rhipicephalus sanguineus]